MKKFFIALSLLIFSAVPSFADNLERVRIYYDNGVTYFKDKKYSSAISEFKKVMRQCPYDKTVQDALAMAYLSRAQYYKDSEKSYKKAINDYRSALVYLKYWDGDISESKAATAQSAENTLGYLKRMYAPLNTPDAISNEAKSLRAQGEFAASIYEYTALFKNSKYNKNAYSTASDIYKSLNNEKMAIECIRNAISNSSGDGNLHFKFAVLLDDIGNADAAMDEYSSALEYSNGNQELLTLLQNLWMARSVQNPNDSQALINLGAILQKEKQYELARAQYIKARQINPNDPVVLINLASVYTELADYDNAIKIYDEMISKNPGDLSARFYKAKLYEKRGEKGAAIAQYKEILRLKKDDENAQNALNSLLSGLTGSQLAGYLHDEAQNNPQSYDAQFKYAFEMHKNKGYSAAIEYYKKAISINSSHPEPFINLAQIFIEQQDFERAKNVLAHGLSVMPDNKDLKNLQDTVLKTDANTMFAKGAELYNSENYQSALEYYMKIPYQTVETYTMIGNCYYEMGQNEKAVEYYNKALNENPKDENVLYMAANALINSKHENEGKIYLNRLLSINPNNQNAKIALEAINSGQEASLLNSAISLYENKRFDEAMDILNKISSKNSYANYYKGIIYEEKGETDNALAEYKKSITADPNFSLGYYMTAVALDTKEDYKEAAAYYDKFIQLKTKEGTPDEFSTYAQARTKELKEYLSRK